VRLTARYHAAALLLALVLAAGAGARAAGVSGARARSQAIVADAEQLILAAGKSDPLDTSKVHAAVDRLREAVQVDPRNDEAYVDLGFCYGLLRDPDSAIKAYTAATKLNPTGTNFKELADIYLRTGEPDDALMAANAGLVKDPKNASLYNAKGMALNDMMRQDEAIAAFRRAVQLDPTLDVARQNLEALSARKTSISR